MRRIRVSFKLLYVTREDCIAVELRNQITLTVHHHAVLHRICPHRAIDLEVPSRPSAMQVSPRRQALRWNRASTLGRGLSSYERPHLHARMLIPLVVFMQVHANIVKPFGMRRTNCQDSIVISSTNLHVKMSVLLVYALILIQNRIQNLLNVQRNSEPRSYSVAKETSQLSERYLIIVNSV
jgi:hypothetical protein